MPTVLKKKVRGSDENFNESRPKHLAAIGLVSVNWVSIEEGLQQFFQQILSYKMCMQVGWYQRDHPLLLANTDTLYTEKDILFIAKEIREADVRLSQFFFKCHHAYGDQYHKEKSDNPPIPPRPR